jgi:hypothetical protein
MINSMQHSKPTMNGAISHRLHKISACNARSPCRMAFPARDH